MYLQEYTYLTPLSNQRRSAIFLSNQLTVVAGYGYISDFHILLLVSGLLRQERETPVSPMSDLLEAPVQNHYHYQLHGVQNPDGL